MLFLFSKIFAVHLTSEPISLHEPDFHGTKAWEYVKDCLDTGWVGSGGQWVTRFEQELCHRTGARYAVAGQRYCCLRLAYILLVGIGDEVLASAQFCCYCKYDSSSRAFPHFIDTNWTQVCVPMPF